MKYLCLFFLLMLQSLNLRAQSVTLSDINAYDNYLSKTFVQHYPLQLLQTLYEYMSSYDKDSIGGGRYVFKKDLGINWGHYSADYTKEGPVRDYTPTELIGTQRGFSTAFRHYDDRLFPDSLRSIFKSSYRSFRRKYPNSKSIRKELTSQLIAFDKVSTNKPLFFKDITKDYNNDISKYVDELCKNSILVSEKKYQKFLRNPSAKKVIEDMGVQFAISIAFYHLWLTEHAEEE